MRRFHVFIRIVTIIFRIAAGTGIEDGAHFTTSASKQAANFLNGRTATRAITQSRFATVEESIGFPIC